MAQKILVIEDEIALQQVLADRFKEEGFSVQTASDGVEGLQKALSWRPDLILLDIVMPKMDGMTMLHKLREDPLGKNLPVILLTNLSDTEDVYEAMANGVFDFLVKSHWELDDLIDEVQAKLHAIK